MTQVKVAFIQKVLLHSSYTQTDETNHSPKLKFFSLAQKVTEIYLKIEEVFKFDSSEAYMYYVKARRLLMLE